MTIAARSAEVALNSLLRVPYFKGKGTLALGILRLCQSQPPLSGRTINGAHVLLQLDYGTNHMLPYLIGQYEREFSKVFLRCVDRLPSGCAFVDVGANVGLYTCMAAQAFRTRQTMGVVHAFEPNPTAYQRLRDNIAVNHFERVICNQIGVSDKSGEFTLYVSDASNTVGSLRHVEAYLTSQITVPVTTLDAYFADRPERIGLIKVDIEGGEFNVFKGAQARITRDQPLILFEENAAFCAAWGHRPEDIHAFLSGLGYTLQVIASGPGGKARLVNLLSPGHDDGQTRNILAKPGTHTGQF